MRGYPFGSAYFSDGSVVFGKSWFSPAAGRSALNLAAAHGVSGRSFTSGSPPTPVSRSGRSHVPDRFGCTGAPDAAAGFEQGAPATSAPPVETPSKDPSTTVAPCLPP